jgi:broad specificity phosphatase PhoE
MSGKLGGALQDAGITRIVLIRHANAQPPKSDQPKKGSDGYPIHDWQRDDQMRPLTDKGKQQGAVAREWFQKDITLIVNKVLVTSGAQRASQTLQLFGEKQAQKKGILSSLLSCSNSTDAMAMEVSMELLPSLHPAGIASKCEELFDKNGYAPLGLMSDCSAHASTALSATHCL